MTQGKTITGRVTASAGASNLSVSASNEVASVNGTVDAEGRYTIEGLPDGAYMINAHAQKDNVWWFGTGKASAGGSVDVELKKQYTMLVRGCGPGCE